MNMNPPFHKHIKYRVYIKSLAELRADGHIIKEQQYKTQVVHPSGYGGGFTYPNKFVREHFGTDTLLNTYFRQKKNGRFIFCRLLDRDRMFYSTMLKSAEFLPDELFEI